MHLKVTQGGVKYRSTLFNSASRTHERMHAPLHGTAYCEKGQEMRGLVITQDSLCFLLHIQVCVSVRADYVCINLLLFLCCASSAKYLERSQPG